MFVTLLMAAVMGMAQPKLNAPLTRFGLGDIVQADFVSSSAMGGLGAAWHHIYQANLVNPASLGHLEATAFELGLFGKVTGLKQGEQTNSVWSGNADYLSLSIPLINPINELLERRDLDFSWGLNISVTPYSEVGYSVRSADFVDSIGVVSRNFQGLGGTNKFNVVNGWKYRSLAVGLKLSYLFGESEYLTETVFDDLFNNYEHVERSNFSVRGWLWSVGAQYDLDLGLSPRQNGRRLTLGVHYNGSNSFTTRGDYINYVQNPFFQTADTARYQVDARSEGTLPSELGVGVRFEETTKWSFGVNYTTTNWSEYVNEARPEDLSDSWRMSGGISYTPDFSSISSFFDRVEYRAGFFYQTDPRSLADEQVDHFGITAGMGMPFVFQRYFSFVNLGLEYGRRGSEDSLKENYLRVRVGITLNDNQWFLKRQFN